MNLQLKDQVVLLTGGSSGIGLATAQQFAREGARLFICARGEGRLREAAGSIAAETGTEVGFHACDVTRPAEIDGLRDAVMARFGRVDVLVNNAGTGIYKPFLEVTDDELVNGMALNFFAQFRVTQRIAPVMIRQGAGAIVNVAGCSGLQVLDPPFFSTCTGPAKAAEIRFTKALAAELGQHGIRVNCVAPNFVEVPERTQAWVAQMSPPGTSPEETKKQWAQRVALPGKRWCTLDEAAATIVFAASPAAGYTTGEVFVVDGGFARD
ncbi:SDR family NAD(P)-dependent oxidoreductase [Ramlibacter albus]|uniref:SDR family oxidoreductase n=1 Tax=Ramlibacter albus TaxID=2079448 RepID=A0A923MCW5_9BURK|nr:SDR family oxidoreductase [Ramlibacter albus]MBC5767851.1 SDR family oxidoreductase [Ramlibacter albus]